MTGDREPTAFGWFILHKMTEQDLSQTELGRLAGVSQSTINRWIYGSGRPNSSKLDKLAEVLVVDYGELLAMAGYGRPAEDFADAISSLRPSVQHRLAREIDQMLNDRSPIPEVDREALATILDRVIEPYRRLMRRRRSA